MVIGIIVILVGAFFLVGSSLSVSQTFDSPIPAGSYYYVQMSGLSGGKFTVMVDTGGVTTDVYYFNQAQFSQFQSTGSSDSIYHSSGSSVTFSQNVPSTDNYYVVVYPPTSVSAMHMTFDKTAGTYVPSLIIGIVLLIVGVIVIILSVRMDKKEKMAAPMGPPVATGAPVYDNTPKQP